MESATVTRFAEALNMTPTQCRVHFDPDGSDAIDLEDFAEIALGDPEVLEAQKAHTAGRIAAKGATHFATLTPLEASIAKAMYGDTLPAGYADRIVAARGRTQTAAPSVRGVSSSDAVLNALAACNRMTVAAFLARDFKGDRKAWDAAYARTARDGDNGPSPTSKDETEAGLALAFGFRDDVAGYRKAYGSSNRRTAQ